MIFMGMEICSNRIGIYAVDGQNNERLNEEIFPNESALKKLLDDLGDVMKVVAFELDDRMNWIVPLLERTNRIHIMRIQPTRIKWIRKGRFKRATLNARDLAELARSEMLPRAAGVVDSQLHELRELVQAKKRLQGKRLSLIKSIRRTVGREGVHLPMAYFHDVDWQEHLTQISVSRGTKAIISAYQSSIDALLQSESELSKRIKEAKDVRRQFLDSIPGFSKLSPRLILNALSNTKHADD